MTCHRHKCIICFIWSIVEEHKLWGRKFYSLFHWSKWKSPAGRFTCMRTYLSDLWNQGCADKPRGIRWRVCGANREMGLGAGRGFTRGLAVLSCDAMQPSHTWFPGLCSHNRMKSVQLPWVLILTLHSDHYGLSGSPYCLINTDIWCFPGDSDAKESACNMGDPRLGVEKIPWRRARQPTPVFLPGASHGHRNLAGYSP